MAGKHQVKKQRVKDASQMAWSCLEPVIEALKEHLDGRLVAVVLFGSRARGEAEEHSDWDLLVIARDLPPRPFRRYRVLKAMLPLPWRGCISLLAKTPEEFEASLPALYLDIALDGVILYDPEHYAREKLAYLQALIRRKGLCRERVGRSLVWRWQEFPGFDWSIEWGEIEQGV